jgi:hypothetical protein
MKKIEYRYFKDIRSGEVENVSITSGDLNYYTRTTSVWVEVLLKDKPLPKVHKVQVALVKSCRRDTFYAVTKEYYDNKDTGWYKHKLLTHWQEVEFTEL